jgi:GNAT superfamily N-acetyltransferase
LSLAVVDEGLLVGTLLCGHDGRRGFLQHMAVAEPYRRLGLGRQLVERTFTALSEIGIHKCHVFVMRENPFAGLFWERLGWERRDDIQIYSGSWEQP